MQPTEPIFQSISTVAKFSGIMCISINRVSNTLFNFGNIYLVALIIIFALNSILISTVFWQFNQGGGSSCTVSVMDIYGGILAAYYILRGEEIFQNFQDLLDVQKSFSVGKEEDFLLYKKVFEKPIRRINRFIKYFFYFAFMLVPINSLQKILAYESEYLKQFLSKNNLVLYPVYYFNVASSPAIFWATLTFESVLLQTMIVLHTVNDLYILNVTVSLILSLRYLRLKLKAIMESDPETENPQKQKSTFHLEENTLIVLPAASPQNRTGFKTVEEQVKMWVVQHNHVLRLSREFVSLYTPVMVAFFLFVFTIGSMGIFYITKGQAEFFSVTEKIMINTYFVGDVTLFMLICMAGSYLQAESLLICQDGFHAPWYTHNRSIKTALLTISSVCRFPVRLTPKQSHTAELSLTTFVWVVNSMASFYIAFSRIQAIFNQNSSSQ